MKTPLVKYKNNQETNICKGKKINKSMMGRRRTELYVQGVEESDKEDILRRIKS